MNRKEQVISMLIAGKTVKEISKELDMLNSNVYKIKSDYLKEKRIKELELQINK